MSYPKRDPVTRFWPKVKKAGPDECWLWVGAGGKGGYGNGYGYFWDGVRQVGAHQFSLVLATGVPLKPGECALHTCDNPTCVNPAHLFAGTNKQNADDMSAKGRQRSGFEKLTEDDVRAIRKEYVKYHGVLKHLADKYGVTPENIACIVKRISWKHVK